MSGNVTVAGDTVNGSGLKISGSGTFTGNSNLSGINTISGGATVLSGTLTSSGTTTGNFAVMSNAIASQNGVWNGAVTVNHGATLSNNGTLVGAVNVSGVFNGTGKVDGALTIKSTGELTPGNSPGTTTVTGVLTVEGGAKVSMQLDGQAQGNGYDQIVVTNTGSVVLQKCSDLIAAHVVANTSSGFNRIEPSKPFSAPIS